MSGRLGHAISRSSARSLPGARPHAPRLRSTVQSLRVRSAGAASMRVPCAPRRSPTREATSSSSHKSLSSASSLELFPRTLSRFLGNLLRRLPTSRLPRTLPPSHSSPISFSLTLGGKLAIYGAPFDSGDTMQMQRQRRERRRLRGVTRARSLPSPGTEGWGGDGRFGFCWLPRESTRRPPTKLRSQTQTKDCALALAYR